MSRRAPPKSSPPHTANYASEAIVFAAGAAIFHLASGRVVVCRHPARNQWFLPKGRREAGEESGVTAVREGFEESGYRARLLPLPVPHRQPRSDAPYSTEPLWTQLVPTARAVQYLVSWYAAETLSPAAERAANAACAADDQDPLATTAFVAAAPWEEGVTLERRRAWDEGGYGPPRHLGTGVDEEERTYEAHLLAVEEAVRVLAGSVMGDVVRRAWAGIVARDEAERDGGDDG